VKRHTLGKDAFSVVDSAKRARAALKAKNTIVRRRSAKAGIDLLLLGEALRR
jgi:hypothetical protein